MSERRPTFPVPHFLRVVQSIARVSAVAAPVAVVMSGVLNGCSDAGQAMGVAGGGGVSTTSSSTSHGGGSTTAVGVAIMPDGGSDGGDGGH